MAFNPTEQAGNGELNVIQNHLHHPHVINNWYRSKRDVEHLFRLLGLPLSTDTTYTLPRVSPADSAKNGQTENDGNG